jgi:hypothetical protein
MSYIEFKDQMLNSMAAARGPYLAALRAACDPKSRANTGHYPPPSVRPRAHPNRRARLFWFQRWTWPECHARLHCPKFSVDLLGCIWLPTSHFRLDLAVLR